MTSFQGWQSSLQKRFHSGWLFSANYMWGHSLNDGAVVAEKPTIPKTSPAAPAITRTATRTCGTRSRPTPFMSCPSGKAASILVAELGEGCVRWVGMEFDLHGTHRNSRQHHGRPERPNPISGVSLIPAAGQTVNNWINIAAFAVPANGTFGYPGRNLARGPGLSQFDTSLGNKFHLTERFSAELSASAFNVFNRAQFALPAGDISSAAFGRITTTVNSSATGSGTPRQFQFMVRVVF